MLAFINVATRKVFVTPSCFKPDAVWMKDQVAAFVRYINAYGLKARLLTRDRDIMYRNGIDSALRDAGIAVKIHLPRSPNLQAYVERFIQTIGQECLDHFVILGQRHFDHLITEFVAHYLAERPHQRLGNVPLSGLPPAGDGNVVCRERLGGLLRHYERRAAA